MWVTGGDNGPRSTADVMEMGPPIGFLLHAGEILCSTPPGPKSLHAVFLSNKICES